jgi:hypothetical protein
MRDIDKENSSYPWDCYITQTGYLEFSINELKKYGVTPAEYVVMGLAAQCVAESENKEKLIEILVRKVVEAQCGDDNENIFGTLRTIRDSMRIVDEVKKEVEGLPSLDENQRGIDELEDPSE